MIAHGYSDHKHIPSSKPLTKTFCKLNSSKTVAVKAFRWYLVRDLIDRGPQGGRVELARCIKEHRERLGMSQSELAKKVFVSRQTISRWGTEGV